MCRISFSLLMLCFSLVPVLIRPARAAAQGEPLPIKTVVFWEELLKQPAIDVGDGVKVRLGIDSLECPRWSGVAMYAYTEGFDDEKGRPIN